MPMPFKLQAKGTLEPIDRHRVFAGIDGVVEEVFVDHGQEVQGPKPAENFPGRCSPGCGTQTWKWKSVASPANWQLRPKRLTKPTRFSCGARGASPKPERTQLQGRLAELQETLGSLDQQRQLLLEKQKQLTVFSPADGQVITWDVKNLLKERPVRRGDVLMEIANPQGAWQLEVLMPERRMGHIARMRSQIKARDPQDDLLVEYVLASQPDRTLRGKVTEIHAGS